MALPGQILGGKYVLTSVGVDLEYSRWGAWGAIGAGQEVSVECEDGGADSAAC